MNLSMDYLKITAHLLVGFTVFSLMSCSTSTQPSSDIASQYPHPAPIFNFQIVEPAGVYRSGQPSGEADWQYLENIGVTIVIKLNKFSSNVDEAEEYRMASLHNIRVIPIYMQPEDFPHNLNLWAKPSEEQLMDAVKALENRGSEKILIHCSHGKDRTGLVVAAYSVRNKNYCKDAALAQMKFYGTNPLLFGLKPMLQSDLLVENNNCSHSYN